MGAQTIHPPTPLPPDPPLAPRCPRCGYDVSGVMGCWHDSCPLEGTCSECGLVFRWGDVLDERRLMAPGFVEHQQGGVRRVVSSAWKTLGWTILPWRFWSRVRLEHRIVPGRWLAWAVCVLLPIHAVASLASNSRLIVSPSMFSRPGAPALSGQLWWILTGWTYPLVSFNPWSGGTSVRWLVAAFPVALWIALAVHGLFWAQLLLLHTTRATAGVRALHVHRAGAFGLAWLAAFALFRAVRNTWLVGEAALSLYPSVNPRVVRLAEFDLRVTALPLLVWTCLWWLFAMRDGWRIERWGRLWLVLAVGALLAGAAAWQWAPELQRGTWRYLLPGGRGR